MTRPVKRRPVKSAAERRQLDADAALGAAVRSLVGDVIAEHTADAESVADAVRVELAAALTGAAERLSVTADDTGSEQP